MKLNEIASVCLVKAINYRLYLFNEANIPLLTSSVLDYSKCVRTLQTESYVGFDEVNYLSNGILSTSMTLLAQKTFFKKEVEGNKSKTYESFHN